MQSPIENQTIITKPIFQEWKKSNTSAAYKKLIRTFTIIMAVLVVGFLVWVYSQGIPLVMMASEFLLMLALYLWVVFMPYSRNRKQYKALCKGVNGTPKRTVCFYPYHIVVTTESGKTRDFPYEKIHTMKETEHLYVLVNDSNLDIILDKNGFISGTIEQVKELLPEKCQIIPL